MGVKKFINSTLEAFNLGNFEINGKKKSLKTLLLKLKKKRVKILKELKEEQKEEKVKELKEELELVTLHITKGKKKLETLKKS